VNIHPSSVRSGNTGMQIELWNAGGDIPFRSVLCSQSCTYIGNSLSFLSFFLLREKAKWKQWVWNCSIPFHVLEKAAGMQLTHEYAAVSKCSDIAELMIGGFATISLGNFLCPFEYTYWCGIRTLNREFT
jgi:hypothetical protein